MQESRRTRPLRRTGAAKKPYHAADRPRSGRKAPINCRLGRWRRSEGCNAEFDCGFGASESCRRRIERACRRRRPCGATKSQPGGRRGRWVPRQADFGESDRHRRAASGGGDGRDIRAAARVSGCFIGASGEGAGTEETRAASLRRALRQGRRGASCADCDDRARTGRRRLGRPCSTGRSAVAELAEAAIRAGRLYPPKCRPPDPVALNANVK